MKKIFVLLLVLIMSIQPIVTANHVEELSEIKSLLETGNIKNYETILIPLRGDPSGFNIEPTDDLSTIRFGDGVAGYKVDFEALAVAKSEGKTEITPYLIEENKYYFPIFVSGRAVAMAEIIKEDGLYRVFCVSAGTLFDNFIVAFENIDLSSAKYVTETTAINGLVVDDGMNELFLDLNYSNHSASKEIPNGNITSGNLVNDFMQRKGTSAEKSAEAVKIGGGSEETVNKSFNGEYVIPLILLICGGAVFVLRQKRKKT